MFETVGVVVDIHRPRRVAVGGYRLHNPEVLETTEPGHDLAALIASVDPELLDAYDLVSYLGACERQIAWTQSRQMSAMRALASRRLVTGPRGEPVDSDLPAGSVNEHAADEVAAVLFLARSTGQQRVWLATALSRLPATEALFEAGQLTLSKVRAIVEALSVLDDEAACVAEARVLARAPEQTLGNLKRALRRAVLVADPRQAEDKAERAKDERTVLLTPLDDGMCELWALLPAPDAMALWSAITALADQAGAADRKAAREAKKNAALTVNGAEDNTADPAGAEGPVGEVVVRSMSQRRADVLADLAYAVLEREDLPRRHGRRPHIQVTVAATTLLGLDEQPGELAGYGPITADVARQVAVDGTWRRLLVDPATGGLLDYGRTTHDPPANLADHVIARDQTCRGLGCRIAAERCDIDHAIRYPDGPTADHNLSCLCRWCHIGKHQAGWTLTLHPNGDVTWTSPTGHRYVAEVPPVLDYPPF